MERKNLSRMLIGAAILILLITIFINYNYYSLSPSSRTKTDSSTNTESVKIGNGLKINLVGSDSIPVVSFSLEEYTADAINSLSANAQITGNIIAKIPAPAPVDSCSDPQFLDPNPNILQGIIDVKGRYVVWEEGERSGAYELIKGYDLGQDKKFNTLDDGGLITLHDSRINGYNHHSSQSFRPRVNDQGTVVFEGKATNDVYLLTCSFSNCQTTLQTIDVLRYQQGAGIPPGQFFSHDINGNTIVSTKQESYNLVSKLVKYDIATGTPITLMQMPLGRSLNLDRFWDTHIDDNGVITATKLTGSLLGIQTEEAYFFPTSAPLTPIRYLSTSGQVFTTSVVYSNRAYQIGQETLAFFDNIDTNSLNFLNPRDIGYNTYQNSLSNPKMLYLNNGIDELNIKSTFNTQTNRLMIALNSQETPSSEISLKTLIYNPQTNTFGDYKSITIPNGYMGYSMGELDNFNSANDAINLANRYARETISEC